MTGKYEIIVGNVGTVYTGNDEAFAEKEYAEYVNWSVSGFGRAQGEPVTFFEDGEIIKEHEGERHDY